MNTNSIPAGGEDRAPCISAPKCPPPASAAADKKPYVCDRIDFAFALVFYAFSYFYIWCWTGGLLALGRFSYAALTCIYVVCVLGYLYARGVRPGAESWFWLAILLGLGVPLGWYGLLPTLMQFALVHLVALYWTLAAAGTLADGRTGNFLPLDCLMAWLVLPVVNFLAPVQAMRAAGGKGVWRRRLGLCALGVLIAAPLLALVLPLLSSADTSFAALLIQLRDWFLIGNAGGTLVRLLLALPMCGVLFGLAYGAARRRHTDWYKREEVSAAVERAHVLPATAALAALGVMCAVYALFIALQGRYLFSAFMGHLPGAFSYAAYARQGFFELCRIGGVNVCLLLGAHLLTKTGGVRDTAMRVCNIVLSALSLLLAATAVSKMGLYIAAYGLTAKRVAATTFLVWLMLVFCAVIVWEFKRFGIARLSVCAGAVLVCLLCVLPVGHMIGAYNDAHGFTTELGTVSWLTESMNEE